MAEGAGEGRRLEEEQTCDYLSLFAGILNLAPAQLLHAPEAESAMAQRSHFKDLLALLGTLRGDLANITAPPAFLAPLSVLEVPSCWPQRPSLFIAPALEPDPLKRSLLVLELVLRSLTSQYYTGLDSNASMRKPLNAFLGELFFGQWTDEAGTTKLLTEQVSHHPPVTASYLSNEEHGIKGFGYARVEMTFNGSLNIKQIGHLLLRLEKYSEDYFIPLPLAKVKGFLSRKLYPELVGTYHIVSSSGFISEISFGGEGFFSGTRHSFHAKIYRASDKSKASLYTLSGNWNRQFTVTDTQGKQDSVTCDVNSPSAAPLHIADPADQDPWESRRAWGPVLDAIKRADWFGIIREKSKLEDAQRTMRRSEAKEGLTWEPRFFTAHKDDEAARILADQIGVKLNADRTKGVWRFDPAKARDSARPYHGHKTPFGDLPGTQT